MTELKKVKGEGSKELAKLEDVVSLDFTKLYEKAGKIFGDLSLIDNDDDDIQLKELEISKAKANNFLQAIQGVIEIQHQVEVLSAQQDQFKRRDELRTLHSLRRLVDRQAAWQEGILETAEKRLKALEESDVVDKDTIDSICSLNDLINNSVEAGAKLISAFSRLVQLERYSAGRPFGAGSGSGAAPMGLIKIESGMGSKANKKGGSGGVRTLSKEDMEDLDL